MLKHVQVTRSGSGKADTLSLHSTVSYGSSASQDELSSRSSSTCSLQEPLLLKPFTIPIKVYASVLRSDIEYKTLSVRPQTTSKDIISSVLNKYKMKHRDPNLFYLTMEVGIRRTGIPIRTILVLDDESKPAELQACHPLGHSKFSLQMRRGGLVKVYDSCLMAGSQYKSLLISERTTSEELIQLLLNCYSLKDQPYKFSLVEVCKPLQTERKLHFDDTPLLVQQQWPSPEHYAFHVRRNVDISFRRKVPWTRSLDVSGHLNFRLTLRDEVSPRIIHSPTLKPSYNDYENYFYI